MTDPMDGYPGAGVPGGYPGQPPMPMEIKEGKEVVLEEGQSLTPELVLDALRPIQDPEIFVSIVDLGLIYGVDVSEDGTQVTVRMTLTGPGCPVGPQILAAVHHTVERIPGVKEPDVQLVWDPPWNPVVHASDEAKDVLGIW
jgi:metal-sulfur cluster biosynthetic enzyme